MVAAGLHRYGYSARCSARLYNAMARPIVEYGTEVWTPAASLSQQIQRGQNWAARTILGLPKHTPEPALLSELGWYPASTRRDELKLRRFYRLHRMEDDWVVKRIYQTRRQDWLHGRRRNGATPWCYAVADIAQRVGLDDAWRNPDAFFAEPDEAGWNELVADHVRMASEDADLARMRAMPSLQLYTRVAPTKRILQPYLEAGTRRQQQTMRRLRTGVLGLPSTTARMRPRSDRALLVPDQPEPCPACGSAGPADEQHFLIACAYLHDVRDRMWQAIAQAAKQCKNVDWTSLVTGNLDDQLGVLLLARPLPGLDGKEVPLLKAKSVMAAVLAGVDDMWQVYTAAGELVDDASDPEVALTPAPV